MDDRALLPPPSLPLPLPPLPNNNHKGNSWFIRNKPSPTLVNIEHEHEHQYEHEHEYEHDDIRMSNVFMNQPYAIHHIYHIYQLWPASFSLLSSTDDNNSIQTVLSPFLFHTQRDFISYIGKGKNTRKDSSFYLLLSYHPSLPLSLSLSLPLSPSPSPSPHSSFLFALVSRNFQENITVQIHYTTKRYTTLQYNSTQHNNIKSPFLHQTILISNSTWEKKIFTTQGRETRQDSRLSPERFLLFFLIDCSK